MDGCENLGAGFPKEGVQGDRHPYHTVDVDDVEMTGFQEAPDLLFHPPVPKIVFRMAVIGGKDRAVEVFEYAVRQLINPASAEEAVPPQHR